MAFWPLDCTTIVYRAITRASDINKETRTVHSEAFLRRPRDIDGLSVNYNCHPKECGPGLKKFGVASLHTGRIRSLELDVEPNEATHANITGLPVRDTEANIAKAEELADRLVEQARVLDDAALL